MVQLHSKTLSLATQQHLNDCQQDVDTQPNQQAKVQRANNLWQNKHSGNGQEAFDEIRETLDSMHARSGVCQYCEWNEISPIEHFFPKKHFPEKAFVWENYLRICHNCNGSEYKHDKFAVFLPDGIVFHLPITRGTYHVPPSSDHVLINPRTEDPAQFLNIDLATGSILQKLNATPREFEKANYTRNLLGLNTRDVLLRGRKKAAQNYFSKLEKYVRVCAVADFLELNVAISNHFGLSLDVNKNFESEKERLKTHLKNDILDDPFPFVWAEMKRQQNIRPNLQILFRLVPEALLW